MPVFEAENVKGLGFCILGKFKGISNAIISNKLKFCIIFMTRIILLHLQNIKYTNLRDKSHFPLTFTLVKDLYGVKIFNSSKI